MKKLAFLLVLIMLLSMFTGCHSSEPAQQPATQPSEAPQDEIIYCPAPISKSLRDQLDDDYLKEYSEYVPVWYSDKNGHGTSRCYGTDNGYVIFSYDGGPRMQALDISVIDGVAFGNSVPLSLFAYKDGVFLDLADAYTEDLVSREAIVAARKYHNQYLGSGNDLIADCCPGPIFLELQQRIQNAYLAKGSESFGTWYSEENPDGDWRYYEGDILLYFGGEQEQTFTTLEIGGVTFSHPTGFQIYYFARPGDSLVDLTTEDPPWDITKELTSAAQQHIECNNAVFGEGWEQ